MKRFALFTATLSLALLTGLLCACHKPSEPSVSTVSASSSVTSASESVTASTTALTETTPVETSDPSSSSEPSIIASETGTFVEDRHVAKGKFNYVLKNKSWKYDGEMYYHKYSDGTVVYYDKESKAYFLVDSKGQGWYYDADIKDFVRDE